VGRRRRAGAERAGQQRRRCGGHAAARALPHAPLWRGGVSHGGARRTVPPPWPAAAKPAAVPMPCELSAGRAPRLQGRVRLCDAGALLALCASGAPAAWRRPCPGQAPGPAGALGPLLAGRTVPREADIHGTCCGVRMNDAMRTACQESGRQERAQPQDGNLRRIQTDSSAFRKRAGWCSGQLGSTALATSALPCVGGDSASSPAVNLPGVLRWAAGGDRPASVTGQLACAYVGDMSSSSDPRLLLFLVQVSSSSLSGPRQQCLPGRTVVARMCLCMGCVASAHASARALTARILTAFVRRCVCWSRVK